MLSLITVALAVAVQTPPTIDTVASLSPTRYELDIRVDLAQRELVGRARITVRNTSRAPVQSASVLLYRLMTASEIRDSAGAPLPFTQSVVEFSDFPALQVRQIIVALPRPIAAGASTVLDISYRGLLRGYSETGMSYVRDRIDSAYTLIRDDAYAFPMVRPASFRAIRAAGPARYDYVARITVPDAFTVANGGNLVRQIIADGWITFEYRNLKPAWRMDFAVARFSVRQAGPLRVFHLPEDSAGGVRVIGAMQRGMAAFSRWFGPLQGDPQFTVVELPDGWGSQTDVTSILQTAAAFRDPKRQYELYHELSHLWNVTSKDLPSPRWNEGLASLLEDVMTDSLDGRMTTDSAAERMARWLAARVRSDTNLTAVPMVDYGRAGMTDYAYSVGSVMFYTLYRVMGHQAFSRLIGEFYRRYEKTGASTADFARLANEVSPAPVHRIFDDWMFTTNWTKLIESPARAMPDRYRSAARR